MSLESRKSIYKGRIVDLGLETTTLPNGRTMQLEVIRHPGAAAVVPLMEDESVVLIKQFRYASGGYLWEIPAGVLEPGEDPATCARRELQEETGYTATEWTPLVSLFSTPGFTNEMIHLFMARRLLEGARSLDPDECLDTHRVPLREALNWIQRGEIRDAKTLVGLLTVAQMLGKSVG